MLPPRGILEAPWHIGTARLRGAGSSGIKVTYAQTVNGVELVVHLSQHLVEVIGGGNITLPLVAGRVGKRNVVVNDLRSDWIDSVRTDYVSDAVADERQAVLGIDGLGPGGREVAGTFQSGGNDGAA